MLLFLFVKVWFSTGSGHRVRSTIQRLSHQVKKQIAVEGNIETE